MQRIFVHLTFVLFVCSGITFSADVPVQNPQPVMENYQVTLPDGRTVVVQVPKKEVGTTPRAGELIPVVNPPPIINQPPVVPFINPNTNINTYADANEAAKQAAIKTLADLAPKIIGDVMSHQAGGSKETWTQTITSWLAIVVLFLLSTGGIYLHVLMKNQATRANQNEQQQKGWESLDLGLMFAMGNLEPEIKAALDDGKISPEEWAKLKIDATIQAKAFAVGPGREWVMAQAEPLLQAIVEKFLNRHVAQMASKPPFIPIPEVVTPGGTIPIPTP